MPSNEDDPNVGFLSSQYDLGLGQALGDGAAQIYQSQPMLACFNEDAAKAYQCPVDTSCCGSGGLGDEQSWNKCCMAGNSNGFSLNLWATLGICMGALILLATAFILYMERRRRGATRKEENPESLDIEAGMRQMKLQPRAKTSPNKSPGQDFIPTDAPHTLIPTESGNIVVAAAPSPLPGKRKGSKKKSASPLTVKNRLFSSPQRHSPAQESDTSPAIPSGIPVSPVRILTPESALSRMPLGLASPSSQPASPASSYPESPGMVSSSPPSCSSSSSPAQGRSASSSQQRRSRFAGSERRALGEIDTNTPPAGTTSGACVSVGSTICQPSAERFKGKENQ